MAAMIGATLALTLGATLLGAYRVSGSPAGAGIVVFLGAWFVAVGCALQLGAILDRVTLAGALRFLLKVTAWAAVLAATGWAILRAPGPELLTGLLTVPVLSVLWGSLSRVRTDGQPSGSWSSRSLCRAC
jgi:hypothetical protein